MKIEFKTFFKRLYEKALFEEDVLSTAAQVAFYFSFALFPLLLFLISLFGLILVSADDLRLELFWYLRKIMPYSAFELVQTTIKEVTENTSGGKITLGILIALWSASAGVDSLRVALNSVYSLKENRSWIKTKLISLVSTFALSVLIMLALGIVFYGWKFLSLILNTINLPISSPAILVVLQIVTMLVVLLTIFALIYNFLPDHKPHRWTWITPGAITGISLWLALSYLFKLYLSYFDTYNKTYGSLGAVIILMLWLLLTALVILIGGIINSILQEMNDPETAAAAAENRNVKLERAKADMPAEKVEEMMNEAAPIYALSEVAETKPIAESPVETKKAREIVPKVSPKIEKVAQQTVSDNVSEENVKTPKKALVGLTAVGLFGFLMGVIFNKKDR